MGKDIVSAIEITDTNLKLVQVASLPSGKAVSFSRIKELVGNSLEEKVRTLKELIAEAEERVEDPVLVVSRRRAVLRYLVLPSNSDVELRKIIAFHVSSLVPFSFENIVWDYISLGKNAAGHAKVLVFVLNKEMVELALKVLGLNGLTPIRVTLTCMGLQKWFHYQMDRSDKNENRPAALISLDVDHSEICFVDKENLYYSQHIDLGVEKMLGSTDLFIEHIRSAVKTFHNEKMSPEIASYLIVSASLEGELLEKALQRATEIPVSVLAPTEGLALQISAQAVPLAIAANLGSLLSSDPMDSANLMPERVKGAMSSRHKRDVLQRMAILFTVSYLLGIAAWSSGALKKAQQYWGMRVEIRQTEAKVKGIEEIIRRLAVLKKEFHERILIADLIDRLGPLTPDDLTYRLIHLDEGNALVLQGESHLGSSVSKLQEQLLNSQYFFNVNLEYATKQQVTDGELTRFKITCQVHLNPGSSEVIKGVGNP